jgi:hypothetical protein
MIALLYAESLAVASRDWRIEECGGHAPHPIPAIYYMTPSSPNCVVEISDTFAIKQKALEVLAFQMSFSAESIKQRANVDALRHIVDNFDELADDNTALGLALHQQFDRSLALYHGLAGHSGAVLGEAYRREGEFVLERLTAGRARRDRDRSRQGPYRRRRRRCRARPARRASLGGGDASDAFEPRGRGSRDPQRRDGLRHHYRLR